MGTASLRSALAHTLRWDLPAAIEEARNLLAPAGVAGSALPESTDVRALALISLGTAELRARRLDEAERHLEQGVEAV